MAKKETNKAIRKAAKKAGKNPTKKATLRMKVIPEPKPEEKRSVIKLAFKGPAFTGIGPFTYVCGKCGNTLMLNIEYKQIVGPVLGCPCGAFNEIPAAHHTN